MAMTAADNGGLIMTEGVEKNGFCVFSILMSAKEAVCPDGRIVPAVFRVSGFYCNSLKLRMSHFLVFLGSAWVQTFLSRTGPFLRGKGLTICHSSQIV